ncbi:MAG: hypothetical protein ACRDZT_04780 [Acidimicrobiales bacterium]
MSERMPDTSGEETTGRDGEAESEPAETPRPLNLVEAVRTLFVPKGPRQRAQPATGTAADAAAVNYIDRRERLIAFFLAAFQAALGIAVYLESRKFVEHTSKVKPIISAAKARSDTLSIHHLAPDLLAINLVLAVFIAGATLTKRRALVGFTILLGGLGMNASGGGGIIGIVYLGVGLWLIFRSMRRRQPMRRGTAARATGHGAGRAAAASSAGRSAGTTRATRAAGTIPTTARAAPPPSKRYTPPTPARRKPPPKAKEPEKESRLTSWLRR